MKKQSLIIASLLGMALIATSCSEKKEKTEIKTEKATAGVVYTCPMHTEVESTEPGTCPKCGMDLVKKESATPKDTTMKMSNDSAKAM